jgi:hypothetical protein
MKALDGVAQGRNVALSSSTVAAHRVDVAHFEVRKAAITKNSEEP